MTEHREQVHHLIDRMPETQIPALLGLLGAIAQLPERRRAGNRRGAPLQPICGLSKVAPEALHTTKACAVSVSS